MHAPSLELRLRDIRHCLKIVHALCAGAVDHRDLIDDDVLAALAEYSSDAADHLYYIERLPGLVLNLPVPDDDDLALDEEASDHRNHEAVCDAIGELIDRELRGRLKMGGAR